VKAGIIMAYEDKRPQGEVINNVVMENRSRISVSGVTDVESFNEQEVIMGTVRGTLSVHGDGLHMERLSVDSGDVLITGSVDGIEYEDSEVQSGGFFSRLFK
jgi:sporulation protein YabP